MAAVLTERTLPAGDGAPCTPARFITPLTVAGVRVAVTERDRAVVGVADPALFVGVAAPVLEVAGMALPGLVLVTAPAEFGGTVDLDEAAVVVRIDV